MSYVDLFLQMKHRYFFEEANLRDVLLNIRDSLKDAQLNGKWVYLCHSNPMFFTLSFLEIVDRGGCPIVLSNPSGFSLDSWSYIEGQWKNEIIPRLCTDKEVRYAVPTSGTTGKPKICEFSFHQGLELAKIHGLSFGVSDEIEIIQTLPVHHSYGIIAYILTPIQLACAVNYCPGLVGLRKIAKDKSPVSSIIHVSPSQTRFLIKDKTCPFHLKKISIGGGSICVQELQTLQDIFPHVEIYVSYGLTEAGPRVTTGKYYRGFVEDYSLSGRETWIGSAMKNIQLKVVPSEEDEECGRLLIKTPFKKLNPLPEEVQGDWLMTRDRVHFKGKEVFFISREDDLLKYGGITIYPRDIESIARKWSGVQDAIVLKETDTIYGDRPILFLEGNISLQDAQELLVRDIPLSTAFQEIQIVERFPRQSLEKIDRKRLMEISRSRRNDPA